MAIDPFPEPRAGARTPTLRHQRSRAFPVAVRQEGDSSTEWSGEHLMPSNGYSSLFTTGLMRQASPSEHVPFPVAYPSTPSLSSQSRRRISSTSSSLSGNGNDHATTGSHAPAPPFTLPAATHPSPRKRSPNQKSSPNKYKPHQHRVHSPAKRSPNKGRTGGPAGGAIAPSSPRKRSTASPRKGQQYASGLGAGEPATGGGGEKVERALEAGMSKLRLAQYTISPFKSRFSTGPRAAGASPYTNPYGAGTAHAASSGKHPNRAYASPSKNQSRWSLSSSDSESELGSSGHRRSTSQSTQQDKDSLWGLGLPRKSGESSRSKMSKMSKMSKASKASRAGGGSGSGSGSGFGFGLSGGGGFTHGPGTGTASSGSNVFGHGTSTGTKSMKKSTSLWSLRSRKSEDQAAGYREGFMRDETGEIVPVLPPMPDPEALAQVEKERQAAFARAQMHQQQQNGQMPQTPGRGRRVVEGLARRLGLTPKKKRDKENVPKTPKTPKTPKGRKSTAPSEFTLDGNDGNGGSPFAFNVPAHALGEMPVSMMPRQRLGSTVTTVTTHTTRSTHTGEADFAAIPPRVPFADIASECNSSGRNSKGSASAHTSSSGQQNRQDVNPHHSAFSFETPRRPSSPFAALARPSSPCASAMSNGSPRELPSAILGLAGSPHTPTNRLYSTGPCPSATPTAVTAEAAPGAGVSGTDSPTPSFIPRMGPKKSSLTTLRSIARKTSTGTLRSVRSFYGIGTSSTPGVDAFETDGNAPPIPRSTSNSGYGGVGSGNGWEVDEVPASCVPITPRRAPKSSIGPPKAQARVSPSGAAFDAPRRAPKTPDSAVKGGNGTERTGATSRAGTASQMRDYADMPVYSATTATTPDAGAAVRAQSAAKVDANTSQMSTYSHQSMSISPALRSMDAKQIASIRDMRTAGKDGRVTPWGERAKERMGMGPGENELRREVLIASPLRGLGEVDVSAFADADEDASPARVNGVAIDTSASAKRGAARSSTTSSARVRASAAKYDSDSGHDVDLEGDGEGEGDDDLDDVITFQSYIRASVATASTTTSPRSADVSMRSMLAQIVEGDGSPTERSGTVGSMGPVYGPRSESAMSKHGPLYVQKRKAVPTAERESDDRVERKDADVTAGVEGQGQEQEQEVGPGSKTPIFNRFARGTTPDLSGGAGAEHVGHGTPGGDSTFKSDLTSHQLVTPRHANVAGSMGRFAPSAFGYKFHDAVSSGSGAVSGLHKPSASAASAFSVSQMTEPSFDSHHLRTSTPNNQHNDSPDSLRSLGLGPAGSGGDILPARTHSRQEQYARTASPVAQIGRMQAYTQARAQTPSPISAANAIATAGFPLTAKQAQAAVAAGGEGADGQDDRGHGGDSTTPKPRRLMDILSTPGKKVKGKTGAIPLRIRPRDGAKSSAEPGVERMPLQPLRGVGNVQPSSAVFSGSCSGNEVKKTYSPAVSIWGDKIPSPEKAPSVLPYRASSRNNGVEYGKENGEEHKVTYMRSTTAMGYNDDRDKQHRYHHDHPSRPVRPARPSSPDEPYARPATSMTHRQHRDYTFSPYDAAPTAHAPAHGQYQAPHRPTVDFSRRMSDQRAFGVPIGPLTASGSGPGDSSFDIATRALDKLRAQQAAADAAAFDMGSVGKQGSAGVQGMGGGSPVYHERQASGGSLRTEESSFTAMTAGTGRTGATTTSREGEWELERYLR